MPITERDASQAHVAGRYGDGEFAGFVNTVLDDAAIHDVALRQLFAKVIDRDGRFRG